MTSEGSPRSDLKSRVGKGGGPPDEVGNGGGTCPPLVGNGGGVDGASLSVGSSMRLVLEEFVQRGAGDAIARADFFPLQVAAFQTLHHVGFADAEGLRSIGR